MIKEIKKEILEKTDSDVYDTLIVQYNDVIEILDKYNNQEIDLLEKLKIKDYSREHLIKLLFDYSDENKKLQSFQKMWEELKNTVIDKGSNGYDDSQTMDDCFEDIFKSLEQKYNLGSDKE